jgi:hypothetical protein
MKVEPPRHFFWLLCDAQSGEFLRTEGGELALGSRADDDACWELAAENRCRSAAASPAQELQLTHRVDGQQTYNVVGEHGQRCSVQGLDGDFLLVRGPSELPSVSLAQMRSEGWTVLPSIVHPDTIADMKRTFYEPGFFSRIQDLVNTTPSVAKTAVHPVMLYLLEEYIDGPIHVGGFNVAITAPVPPDTVSGSGFGQGRGGWHSDYPFAYNQGPNLEEMPDNICLGCEWITCVDDFSELNGVSASLPLAATSASACGYSHAR